MRKNKDLRALLAASALCALLALVLPFDVVRLVFALPLTLFLPGYAIVAATFARRPLAGAKRLLLSVGLSLAVLALGGLVLNFMPGGIRAGSWALLLLLVVLVACRAAALRRATATGDALRLPRVQLSAGAAAVLAAAVLAAVAAMALAFTPLPAKQAVGYTELWLQPYETGGTSGVRIGVGSDEQQRTGYRLRVSFGRDGTPVVRRLVLDPGESRILRIDSDAAPTGRALPVTAALYRVDRPNQPYRRGSTWIPPLEGSG